MSRHVLDEDHIHAAVRERVAQHHQATVDEVKEAVAAHDVLVVGMKQNPFPRKARKLLDARGTSFHSLEYGSYLSEWRRRTAIKMWTGWPTFPMVFVKGQLIGGFDDLQKLSENGGLDEMLA